VVAGNHGRDDNGTMTREDMLVDPTDSYEELAKDEQEKFRRTVILRAVKRRLDEREKIIYLTQLLTEDGQELTLQTLGDRFGVSKERVRQIRERAERLVAREIRRMIMNQEITRADLF
jgi:RNA polymerase sigma-32 factor